MGKVSHSDLLGAMAVVDDMRINNAVTEEGDFNKLRERVAERVKAYYLDNNIEVNDEIIAAGVKAYFASRMAFSAPRLSFGQTLLAKFTSRRLLFPAIILFLAVFAWLFISFVYDPFLAGNVKKMSADWGRYVGSYADFTPENVCVNLKYANGRCVKEAAAVQDLVAEFRNNISTFTGGRPDRKKEFKAAKASAPARFAEFNRAVLAAKRAVSDEQRLVNMETPEFKSLVAKYSQLASIWEPAKQSLSSGNGFESRMDQLEQVAAKARRAERAEKTIKNALSEFKALELNKAEKSEIETIAAGLLAKAKNLEDADTGIIDYYLKLAKTPLVLNIVDRVGLSSGITRTYGSTSDSFYLIVEARDPAGAVFPLNVKSIETGKVSRVKEFGIRVSYAKYEMVRKDKLADGVIDQIRVGGKKAGALGFSCDSGVMNSMITEW